MKIDIPLGEKLRLIRTAKGISQRNMAQAIHISKSLLSYIESGQRECDTATLASIRNFLEINDAPLLDHELEVYNSRLWIWDDVLTANRLADAKAMHESLATIQSLPYQHDMLFTYAVLTARLLLRENNAPKAIEKLEEAEKLIDYANTQSHQIFYQCKGLVCAIHEQHNESLVYLHKALALTEKDDARLLALMGNMYYRLGRCHHAIIYLERAKLSYSGDKSNILGYTQAATLAECYALVGDYSLAKEIYSNVIPILHSMNMNEYLAPALCNRGLLSHREGDFDEALGFYEEARTLCKDNPYAYIIVIHNMALSLIKLKKHAECQALIDQARPMAKDNEYLTLLLDMCQHLMNLGNPASVAYIEDTGIPYLRKVGGLNSYNALYFCRELEAHYNKKKSKINALTMASIIRDIQDELFFNV